VEYATLSFIHLFISPADENDSFLSDANLLNEFNNKMKKMATRSRYGPHTTSTIPKQISERKLKSNTSHSTEKILKSFLRHLEDSKLTESWASSSDYLTALYSFIYQIMILSCQIHLFLPCLNLKSWRWYLYFFFCSQAPDQGGERIRNLLKLPFLGAFELKKMYTHRSKSERQVGLRYFKSGKLELSIEMRLPCETELSPFAWRGRW